MNGLSATPSLSEPEYGREGIEAIRGFYRKLADDEGKVQFHANHPSKCCFLFLNRTVSRFRVHFSFNTVQFKIYLSASLSVPFVIDRFVFHCEFMDPDLNCFPIFSFFKSLFFNISGSRNVLTTFTNFFCDFSGPGSGFSHHLYKCF